MFRVLIAIIEAFHFDLETTKLPKTHTLQPKNVSRQSQQKNAEDSDEENVNESREDDDNILEKNDYDLDEGIEDDEDGDENSQMEVDEANEDEEALKVKILKAVVFKFLPKLHKCLRTTVGFLTNFCLQIFLESKTHTQNG